jgi:D-alanyl-lipoteichoic acid acyltransferase DltB (MBOAT superfamily)
MSFNSRPFLIAFLPVSLLVLTLLRRLHKPDSAKIWLILASLIFYGVGDRTYLPLFAASIIVNYIFGWFLSSSATRAKPRASLVLILLGLSWNLGLLSYFKYWAFLISIFNQMTHGSLQISTIILPLGISFYTFTQLMFLVDSYSGLVESPYRLIDYVLFACFFPYTMAGPIVKHEEIIPQYKQYLATPRVPDILFGCTLFALGLFKKVVLADTLSHVVDPVFEMARHGHMLPALNAWLGSIAFTLQLYFDFSGYSDMAVGIGKLFGIELPYNFNSPYKAVNVIDFWKRWHMTLTRFLTNYIYNPIVLRMTRHRMTNGQSTIRPGKEDLSAFTSLVAFPTLVTMVIAGIWHGAGWTFLCFGLLHGLYIVFNHATHILRRKKVALLIELPRWLSCLSTFLAVTISFVFFRADNLSVVKTFVLGLIGYTGSVMQTGVPLHAPLILIGVLLGVIWLLPNSQELCLLALKD